jgi:hypothetical protein
LEIIMISKFLPSGFINEWPLVSCLKKALPGPRKLLNLSCEIAGSEALISGILQNETPDPFLYSAADCERF